MVDMITETLDNGEEYSFDMDVSHEISETLFDNLMEMQGEVENYDFESTVFCVFHTSMALLMSCGWTPDSLKEEITEYNKDFKESLN